jgi:predicted Zn-dependent protease
MADVPNDPKVLLAKAKRLLDEEYNPEEDSFLLVFTKRGKLPVEVDKAQTTVGEMPIQATSFFVLNLIQNLARFCNEHPFPYIVRRILAPFIDIDRAEHAQMQAQAMAHDTARHRVSSENPDFDGVIIVDTDLTIEN